MASVTSVQSSDAPADVFEEKTRLDITGSAQDNDEESLSETTQVDTNDDVLKSLGSVEGEKLLAFLDHIRNAYELDTGSLDLPQLVVVGGTSCGKSSLLQALTNLPFPVENGICTLFPTETMIHRCDPFVQPHYSITVEKNGSSLHRFKPREYSGEKWSDVSLRLRKDLEEVFAELHAPITNADAGGRNRLNHLREEVLKVNVYKHDQAHFSVIDIPGLVSGGSGADQKISERLARNYICKERAIVLAVMPAVDDIHNQAVLRLVREEGAMHRTIGVITKCDMLQTHDEPKTLELLKNRTPEYRLKLGWFAVRNRTTDEIQNGLSYRDRDDRESQLFSRKPWSSLNTSCVGVSNLKKCLSGTLYRLVQKSFPGIQNDISERLESSKRDLDALGPPRDTWRLQKYYLDDIQTQYDGLARKWLMGTYREDCSSDDSSKLRVRLHALDAKFRTQLERNGMEYRYLAPEDANRRLQELHYMEFPNDWEAKILATDDIFSWILRMWNDNHGDGLWYKAPVDFEGMLWKVQIKSWGSFARDYFSEASRMIQGFSDILLEETCPEPTIRSKIRRYLQEQNSIAIRRAEDELATILNELGHMRTYNRDFMAELHDRQKALNTSFHYIGDNKLRLIISTYQDLCSFQKIALWRFLDNVIIQVVERHLLGAPGLVFCFSVHWIRGLSEKEMDDIAGEDTEQRQKRNALQTEVRELEEILRDSKMLQYK
ncbi:hypothetical protein PENANT_c012G08336 [Penicillium antarcticum]|uniref:GED domain-containing protein n=1 Tax=Penicillium antarcticum TaxID=416450 RepID=A0A1V6Q5X3_9EURO|nr:uncharacterized protein N7508_008201 [Penicillium antarcticum]KAJ5297952.1 hypothetical protein N7508_008201 [Penicillium antarcticum]OQD84634.1 hypothetical protein PENANT_c012G08336 [Penicillium antarcticum]